MPATPTLRLPLMIDRRAAFGRECSFSTMLKSGLTSIYIVTRVSFTVELQ